MIGDWRGPVRYVLTDPHRLVDVPGAMDRWSVRLLPLLPLVLHTTVRAGHDPDVFVHTTRLTALGLPLTTSTERFVIGPGGKAATLEGAQRRWPSWWRTHPMKGGVVVGDDAASAVYRMDLLGAEMVMRNRVVGEGRLEVVQETSDSRLSLVLERHA